MASLNFSGIWHKCAHEQLAKSLSGVDLGFTNTSFQNNFGIFGLSETWITLDKLHEGLSFSFSFFDKRLQPSRKERKEFFCKFKTLGNITLSL